MPGTCVPVLLSLFFILALSTTLSLPPKKVRRLLPLPQAVTS
ncbi:hypothetical protein CPAR01_11448 [Colletotrichum paranaense]|uniref:Uncharacterized protein n=1 Tax=Colletotrichum paranaense TaxID=1914294 RepID=A0ABQ9SBM6_9PEZI|nr:uncharacterized protein CPAR01_11448 [Colletotrichum paranaense]KAK1531799.1 hypothetical protein CPAR01_11448 [Colletotrichum paranaense]